MDEAKLFVGGIAWDTKENTLRDYFGKYGEVTRALIMKDKTTGNSRGFGFVVFSEPSVLDDLLAEKHTIDGRTVEVKRALPREEKQNLRSGDPSTDGSHSFSGPWNCKTKKIFVGGLPATLTDEEFTKYFQNYGDVTDVVIMFDQCTGRPRGFGFITFDTEDAVDKVLEKTFHELNNKLVEVKRALPKEANSGYAAHGRKSDSYSANGVNSPFDSQIESSTILPLLPAASYFPYSCYGALGYGYGFTNSAFYGTYGFGNYGNIALAYGNQTAPNSSFFNSCTGLEKGQWSYLHGSGAWIYNVNAGYGATAPWSTEPLSHSKNGIHRSRNQG